MIYFETLDREMFAAEMGREFTATAAKSITDVTRSHFKQPHLKI